MSGIWPLLAPVLTVIIALLSKNVLLALFAGICYLSVLLNGVNFLMPMADYLIGGVTSNGTTLMTLIPLGIMLWFIRRAGGFKAFAAWSHKKVKDKRQAGGLVFLISCILSAANDLLANVTVGQIVRPVITQKKVSRHKSAFISASTAPNVASFLPFQTYFLFCVGMLGSLLPPEVRPIPFFFMGIPLSFYTLLAILFALLMALDILPQVGPLKRFQRLADEAADCRIEDAVVSDSLGGADVAPDLTAFVLPLASLAVSLVVFSLIAGEIVIIPGMFFACIVSIVYPLIRGSVQFAELSNGFVGGFTEQVPIFLVLLFAFSFGELLNKVGFSQQIVGIFSGAISGAVIPILVFAVACVISYTTGSLGSALVIMLPIAMPLAQATGASLLLTFGAVYSGCQWGDQTSPISDVLIENAGANEVDAIELSACFMPYRLVQLAVCAVLYVALGIILY